MFNLHVKIPVRPYMNLKPLINFSEVQDFDEETPTPNNTPRYSTKKPRRQNNPFLEEEDFKPYNTIKEFLRFYSND